MVYRANDLLIDGLPADDTGLTFNQVLSLLAQSTG
jgi:hypothetical protein